MAEKFVSTAKVIDGILILTLPDAVTPVVWQMELGQSKSSALEIRTAEDNAFHLVLKTPRQDVLEIATYNNRDFAIKALLAISQAMEKSQGQLKAGLSPSNYPVPALSHTNLHYSGTPFFRLLGKTMKFLAVGLSGLALLAILFYIISRLFLGTPSGQSGVSPSNAPVSADEFLDNR